MVKASTFPKHLKSPLTKKNRAEAALRSQAHAASLQAGAARAAAAEIEAEYTDVTRSYFSISAADLGLQVFSAAQF